MNQLPDPAPSRPQCQAAKAAILREYGRVIGEQQAENIAYTVLVAARVVAIHALNNEETG